MKKIQKRVQNYRALLVLMAASTASAIFLPGCDLFAYKQPFPDAYYTSNFIEGIGFDVFEGDNAVVPAEPVTGAWDYAYRYLDWDGVFNYMDLILAVPADGYPGSVASSFGTVPSGLSATAPVYRLELVNLIQDGDFESGISGTWTPTGGSPAALDTGSYIFGSNSVKLVFDLGQKMTFEPALIPSPPAFSGLLFNTYFRFRSTPASFNVKLADSNDSPVSSDGTVKYPVALHPGLTAAPVFTFEPVLGSTLSGLYLDNFRMSRNGNMELRLILTPKQTVPELVDGVYTFSVWVHADPLATETQSPYRTDMFTITMKNTEYSTLSVDSATYRLDSGTGWSKLEASLSIRALQFTSDVQPVLELALQFNDSRPGRVLLASPELRFLPDGL